MSAIAALGDVSIDSDGRHRDWDPVIAHAPQFAVTAALAGDEPVRPPSRIAWLVEVAERFAVELRHLQLAVRSCTSQALLDRTLDPRHATNASEVHAARPRCAELSYAVLQIYLDPGRRYPLGRPVRSRSLVAVGDWDSLDASERWASRSETGFAETRARRVIQPLQDARIALIERRY